MCDVQPYFDTTRRNMGIWKTTLTLRKLRKHRKLGRFRKLGKLTILVPRGLAFS